MNRDSLIIIIGWLITSTLLIIFTPKEKIRQAIVVFMFKQLLTWLLGLTVAELGLIEYPVRSFAKATKTSFDFEYFIYPAFCVLFNLHYPRTKKLIVEFLYYFSFCTALTIIEIIVEKNTNIINYIHWTWYITWASFLITFYASRKFYLWFFKVKDQ